MNALFAPAVGLMNRLKYPYKFALIGTVALLAIAYLLINLTASLRETHIQSQQELDAVAIVQPLLNLVRGLQQHRALSTDVLGGKSELEETVRNKEAEIAELEKGLDDALRAHGSRLQVDESWQGIREEWKTLGNEWHNLNDSSNHAAHSTLIGNLLQLNDRIARSSGLAMDPALDSYLLINTAVRTAPEVLEWMGKIRGAGVAYLNRKAVSDSERLQMASWLFMLDTSLKTLLDNAERAGEHNEALKPQLDAFRQGFMSSAVTLLVAPQSEIIEGQLSMDAEEYYKSMTEAIDQSYAQLHETLFPMIQKLLAERMQKLVASIVLSLGLAALVILVFAYLSAGAYLAIVGSVRALAQATESIAQGDLTVRARIEARDELADVGAGFNAMAQSLNELIGHIQSSAGEVSTAASSLAGVSTQVQEDSQRQSEAASSMAAAVEQTTVSIDQIAQHAREAQEISTQSGALSEEGHEVVNRTVDEMRQIAQSVEESARQIEELGQKSSQISDIVKVIKDIAEQTNLLALNAAIEAARAGETGRGFAVVADEVRKLAERTARSTQDISAMIEAIQSGTHQAVAAMQTGVKRVAEGVDLANQAGQTMSRIREGSARVVQSVSDISLALREQSATSTDIATHVERIARMAEENNSAVIGSARTARQMEQLASGLQEETRRYKVA